MADKKNPFQVNDTAREIIEESRKQGNGKQFILWMAALVVGGALGWMNNPSLNELFNFIATIHPHVPVHRRAHHCAGSHHHPVGIGRQKIRSVSSLIRWFIHY